MTLPSAVLNQSEHFLGSLPTCAVLFQMESPEEDIKPVIPMDNIQDRGLLTVPGAGKLKQSRYEDVWSEDVHAAFMEAVALYPPMGKRRLKYYRVSTHENEHWSDGNQVKSFGRCQLIQSYILEKTGKNRSRKQVSSHLQRLKKIHKGNPAMRPLFSERPQPSEHFSAPQTVAISSQDIFANISFSARHLKSDFDLTVNLQNVDTDADRSMITYPSEASSPNGSSSCALDLSTNFHNQPTFFPQEFLSPQQCPMGAPLSSDSDCPSELQDTLLFKDAIKGGFRAGSTLNTSGAFSISMRRLASKLPTQSRHVDSGLTTHFSRVVHSPGFQPIHQWISRDGLMDGISCNSPPISALAQQAFHPPPHPLQLTPLEKQRFDADLASGWIWPQNPDMSLNSREGAFGEVRLWYPPAMYHYNPTYAEIRAHSPGFHNSPSESEVSQLPRELSYSYAAADPATIGISKVSNDSVINLSEHTVLESPENFASPLVIRPTPVYPISYIHPKIHSDDHTPTPSLPA